VEPSLRIETGPQDLKGAVGTLNNRGDGDLRIRLSTEQRDESLPQAKSTLKFGPPILWLKKRERVKLDAVQSKGRHSAPNEAATVRKTALMAGGM
jgi:hypothetical protein